MRKDGYALRGVCYEIQKTLEAFFGRCEVLLNEDTATNSYEVEVQYKTPAAVKKYRHIIRKELLEYGQGVEQHLSRDIPHSIVLSELDNARGIASTTMNRFR